MLETFVYPVLNRFVFRSIVEIALIDFVRLSFRCVFRTTPRWRVMRARTCRDSRISRALLERNLVPLSLARE